MSFRILAHVYKASVPLTRGHLFSNSFAQCQRYKSEFIIRAFGIPYKSTRSDVKDFFRGCNIVGEENGIHMIYKEEVAQSGKFFVNRTCFIELASEEDVEKALERNNEYMGERYIHIRKSHQRELDSDYEDVRYKNKSEFIIRAFGVPQTATRSDVKDFFKGCNIVGEEKGIHMIYEEKVDRSGEAYANRLCFIELASEEDVEKALERNKRYMGERYIHIRKAHQRELDSNYGNKSEFIISCYGLPWESTPTDVKDFFQGCNIIGEENGIHITYDEKGQILAYVELASDEDIIKALRRNREYMGERYIRIRHTHEGVPKSLLTSKPISRRVKIWGYGNVDTTVEDVNLFMAPLFPADVTLKHKHCFVDFHTDEDVEAALSKDKEYMGDLILMRP